MKIRIIMPQLPLETFCSVVDQFDTTKKQDRRTLRRLLVVSRQSNLLALSALYKHILLSRGDDEEDILTHELGLLARDAEDNPGLRLTQTFSFLFEGAYHPDFYDIIHDSIERIMRFLPNVRRIQIAVDSGPIHARILRTLPSSAPITHLMLGEGSLSSADLKHFLESHPTLQFLEISMDSCRRRPSRDVRMSPSSLPALRSLSIPASELAYFQDPLPSLTNLDIRQLHSLTDVVTDHMVALFASIVSCALNDIFFDTIASFTSNLPNLKYLYLTPLSDYDADDNYNVLSPTKLKYLECHCFSSRPQAVWTLGRRISEMIKTLVVVDVTFPILPTFYTMRMFNGEYYHIVRRRTVTAPWRPWWEDAERAVDLAGRLPGSQSCDSD